MLRIPLLQIFIPKDYAILALKHTLIKTYKSITLDKNITFEKPRKDRMAKYAEGIKTVKKFYSIQAANTVRHQKTNTGIEPHHVRSYYANTFNYYSNFICERLGVSSDSDLSVSKNKELFTYFMLSEIYGMLETSAFDIKIRFNKFILNVRKEHCGAHTRYWFSEFIEQHSQFALHYELASLKDRLSHCERLDPQELYHVIDLILDKEFSIQDKYLRPELRASQQYKTLRNIAGIAILVEIKTSLERTSRVKKSWILRQCFFDEEFLSYFDKKTWGFNRTMGNMLDFISSDESYYYRGNLSFKYGLRRLMGRLLHEFKPQQFNLQEELGRTFERHHILEKLRKLEKYGYRFYEGIEPPDAKAAVKDYDIDLVAHDIDKDIFYFIQICYRFTWLPTYYSERLRFFNEDSKKNSFKKKYDVQLKKFRENMLHHSVQQRLKGKPYAHATRENSHFILLSNIPYLNFYESDGILFYEWNTFRNLIQNGQVLRRTEHEIKGSSIDEKLPLHDPDYIVNRYIETNILDPNTKIKHDIYKNTRCSFKAGDWLIVNQLV